MWRRLPRRWFSPEAGGIARRLFLGTTRGRIASGPAATADAGSGELVGGWNIMRTTEMAVAEIRKIATEAAEPLAGAEKVVIWHRLGIAENRRGERGDRGCLPASGEAF